MTDRRDHAALSPDGHELAFADQAAIEILDLHTEEITRVPAIEQSGLSLGGDFFEFALVGSLTWSGNGERLAFLSSCYLIFGDNSAGRAAFWLASIDRARSDGRTLLNPETAAGLACNPRDGNTLDWSVDDHIYFDAIKDGISSIWRVDADTPRLEQVTVGYQNSCCPQVSADGQRLLYVTETQESNLWSSRLDGGGTAQRTFEEYVLSPVFTPQSGRLTYATYDLESGESELIVENRALGGVDTVLAGDEYIYSFSWSPDERFLLYGSSQPSGGLASADLKVRDENGGTLSLGIQSTEAQWLPSGNVYFLDRSQASGFGSGIRGPLENYLFLDGRIARIAGATFTNALADPSGLLDHVEMLGPGDLDAEHFSVRADERYAAIETRARDKGIVLLDLESGETRRLADDGEFPQWMAEGQSISFCKQGPDSRGWDLWKVNLDGSNEAVLVRVGSVNAFAHAWDPTSNFAV